MSTEQRARRAWVGWILELRHSSSPVERLLADVIITKPYTRNLLRLAFEAGYRSKRKDNDATK